MATTAYNYRITIVHNADTSEETLIRLGAFVKGDEPVLTAGDDGTIYADGQVLTEVLKDASESMGQTETAVEEAEAARQTAETTRQTDEGLRVAAETVRTSNEAQRQSNESSRAAAEGDRAIAETARQTAESQRSTAEAERASAEGARVTNENLREAAEQTRESAEAERRVAETGRANSESAREAAEAAREQQAANDHETAALDHAQYEDDHSAASEDHEAAVSDRARAETDHATAAADHTIAAGDHTVAASDHTQAASDHTTAVADHTTATTDHTNAAADRETASSDHTRANSDHATAVSDHATASSDHSGAVTDRATAESDHTTAASDHSRAEDDHTRAEADHESIADKANVDGVYETLVAGGALSLVAKTTVESEFTFDQIPAAAADGPVLLQMAKGKSLVWNQMANLITSYTFNGVTITYTNGKGVYSGTLTNSYTTFSNGFKANEAGHKYLFKLVVVKDPNGAFSGKEFALFNRGADGHNSAVISNGAAAFIYTNTTPSLGAGWGVRNLTSGTDLTGIEFYVMQIDLTLEFGAGNEPTTVEEFEKWYSEKYYDHNAGEIISNKTESVKLVGFNQWDEEWELGGIDSSSGQNTVANNRLRAKNYIPVIKGGTYYSQQPTVSTGIYQYDDNKNYLGYSSITAGLTFTLPSNCAFIRFVVYQTGITTYNNDICINLSDANRNGQYEPYKTNTISLNLPTLTGKLNGEGSSIVVFPDGMKSAGSAYDEIVGNKAIKRMNAVDMGSLNWAYSSSWGGFVASISDIKKVASSTLLGNIIAPPPYIAVPASGAPNKSLFQASSDIKVIVKDDAYSTAADFAAAVSGLIFLYELDTPLEYTLDTPLPETFQSYKGGTMMQLPQNGSAPTTAPMVMLAQYPMDAAGAINYILQVLANNNLS